MSAIAFNPSRSVVFDLAQGSVRVTPGTSAHHLENAGPESSHPTASDPPRPPAFTHGNPQVLLSTDVLGALIAGHGDPRPLGRAVGTEIAERASLRSHAAPPVDPSFRSLSISEVADLLGGELALVGLGNLRVERWGDALLFVLDPCSLDRRADAFLEGIIEGAVTQAGTSPRARPLATVHARVVDRDDGTIRVLIGNEQAARRATEMYRVGATFTDIVAALQEREG